MTKVCARGRYGMMVVAAVLWTMIGPASGAPLRSIRDVSLPWPDRAQWVRVLSLRDHNTRVVLLGATLLGISAGVVGAFLLLRKRALIGDVASHATLPGIGLAFLVMSQSGGSGKYLPGLLAGAAAAALAGVGAVLFIRNSTRLKEDAALGIVLSVFFGLGISILGVIQKTHLGHAAGLESFIYGKAASMLARDAWLMGACAAGVLLATALLFKELSLLCFDESFAQALGWPVRRLDMALMALVVGVTVIGLQAVGLILVIALLIIPPVAARFWTNNLRLMVFTAAGVGAISGFLGAGLSALVPRLPAGAIMVTVAGLIFLVSMVLGPAQGVLYRMIEHVRVNRKTVRHHLLRALYEWAESNGGTGALDPTGGISAPALLAARSWSERILRGAVNWGRKKGFVERRPGGLLALTGRGLGEARRVVRNHRLWEMYLITYADIAPSHVDRDADEIEHVLGRDLVDQLEGLLAASASLPGVPPSPHPLDGVHPSAALPASK
jgi:manganese/zinc/iron transport system permease protein